MYLITKIFKFDSAHKLLNYNGACENIHGHTYILEVSLKGEKNDNGLVIDFVEVKKIVELLVISKLDHTNLNDIINQPTAENILEWIWDKISPEFSKKSVELFELKLFEGPNSFAAYRGGQDF